MDSLESRMNARFLAESEKGMLWEPRVIESGRGTVEGFKEHEKGKRRASVLSSFSLSWSSVIHVFMCMHWVLWWGWSLHWEERISGAVCHPCPLSLSLILSIIRVCICQSVPLLPQSHIVYYPCMYLSVRAPSPSVSYCLLSVYVSDSPSPTLSLIIVFFSV